MLRGLTAILIGAFFPLPIAAQDPDWEVRAPEGTNYCTPTWSSDGTVIYVSRVIPNEDGGDEAWAIPVDGKEPRRLCKLPAATYCQGVSPDGKTVLTLAKKKELAIRALEGGEIKPIQADCGKNAWSAVPSPDGEWLAWREGDLQSTSTVWISRLDGSGKKQVSPDTFAAGLLTWSADGKMLLIPALDDGGRSGSIHLVSIESGAETVVTIGEQVFPECAALSADGRRLAVVAYQGYQAEQGWLFVGKADGLVPFLRDGTRPSSVAWSPDSRRLVVLGRMRNGVAAARCWTVPEKFEAALSLDGPKEGEVEEAGSFYLGDYPAFSGPVTTPQPDAPVYRFSPDGRRRQLVSKSGFLPQGVPGGGVTFLRWTLGKEKQAELVLMPRDLSGERVLFSVEGKIAYLLWRFSREGDRLALLADDGVYVGQAPGFKLERVHAPETPWNLMAQSDSPRGIEWWPDRPELLLRVGRRGAARVLPVDGTIEALQGARGEAVALPRREWLAADGRAVFRVPLEGEAKQVAELPDECVGLVVSPEADRVFALWGRVTPMGGALFSAKGGIVSLDLETGESRMLGDVAVAVASLSSDGSRLLAAEVYLQKGDINDVRGAIVEYDVSTGKSRVLVHDYPGASSLALGRQMAGLSPPIFDWAR